MSVALGGDPVAAVRWHPAALTQPLMPAPYRKQAVVGTGERIQGGGRVGVTQPQCFADTHVYMPERSRDTT